MRIHDLKRARAEARALVDDLREFLAEVSDPDERARLLEVIRKHEDRHECLNDQIEEMA